jgi:competence protein ComEA
MHSPAAFALRLSITFVLLSPACVQRQRITALKTAYDQQPVNAEQAQRININTASAEELEKLPGIGKALAERIVEHREKYGRFRRAEHLIMVRGISDQKFRAMRNLITVR